MMRKSIGTIAAGLLACTLFAQPKKAVDYVNPFIGTGGHGHTYPGATLPFGMVQLSPDNGTQGWDWCSGYHYTDSVITGFSHTHLSGTGIGDLADISVMPSVGKKTDTLYTPSKFSHDNEKATPGYYQVKLNDFNINAELTSTLRCGLHRYTFPKATDALIRLDLGFAINWDSPVDCYFKKINDTTYVGWRNSKGWAPDQWVYYAIRLSKKPTKVSLFADKKPLSGDSAHARRVIAGFEFSTADKEQVLMKVGLSSASIEGALASLKEISGWNFDAVKLAARNTWEKELSKISIKAADENTKTLFYTALYHTYEAPVLYSDAQGNAKAVGGKNYKAARPAYTVHSLWDVFRGAAPLLTVTQPERVPDIINSYLDFYKQSGLLPVWDLYYNETNCMSGYHCVPIVTDAILKGVKGFDYQLAYKAMKASAMQNIRGTDFYRQYGYLPQDKVGQSVTITLEYAYDDWCIAQVAKKLGYNEDYESFIKRSASFKPLFDPNSGFFRAKNSDGKFVEPFDPYYSDHSEKAMYIEGTAWQHTFFVPHAVEEYASMLGGKDKLIEKLDSLFTTSSTMHGEFISNDISGMIGQYAHGNEPSHHIAYMYNVLGAPEKGPARLREIMTTLYLNNPDGLSGNEDCGQMSAWYVWSALGMYPMNAASGNYVFGSPVIDEATIALPGGKKMLVKVKNNSAENINIKSVKLNGATHSAVAITHAELVKGGVLEIEMGK